MRKTDTVTTSSEQTLREAERRRLEGQIEFNRSEEAARMDHEVLAALENAQREEEALRREHNRR